MLSWECGPIVPYQEGVPVRLRLIYTNTSDGGDGDDAAVEEAPKITLEDGFSQAMRVTVTKDLAYRCQPLTPVAVPSRVYPKGAHASPGVLCIMVPSAAADLDPFLVPLECELQSLTVTRAGPRCWDVVFVPTSLVLRTLVVTATLSTGQTAQTQLVTTSSVHLNFTYEFLEDLSKQHTYREFLVRDACFNFLLCEIVERKLLLYDLDTRKQYELPQGDFAYFAHKSLNPDVVLFYVYNKTTVHEMFFNREEGKVKLRDRIQFEFASEREFVCYVFGSPEGHLIVTSSVDASGKPTHRLRTYCPRDFFETGLRSDHLLFTDELWVERECSGKDIRLTTEGGEVWTLRSAELVRVSGVPESGFWTGHQHKLGSQIQGLGSPINVRNAETGEKVTFVPWASTATTIPPDFACDSVKRHPDGTWTLYKTRRQLRYESHSTGMYAHRFSGAPFPELVEGPPP